MTVQIQGSTIIDDNRNILSVNRLGINNAAPAVSLHINDGTPGIRLQDTDGTNQFADIHFDVNNLFFDARNNIQAGNFIWRQWDNSLSSFTNSMFLNFSGNLGIGTSSISSRLDVVRAGQGVIAEFKDDTGFGLHISTSSASTLLSQQGASAILTLGTSVAGGINITSTGNVGVGINAPVGKFDVNGRGFFANGTAAAPSIANRADTDTGIYFGTGTAGISTDGISRLYIDSNGRVGIGTAAPIYSLEVASVSDTTFAVRSTGTASTDDAFMYIRIGGTTAQSTLSFGDANSVTVGQINYNHSSDTMGFFTSGAQRLSINSTGEFVFGGATVIDQGRNFKSVNSLAVGTPISPGNGQIRATGDITAFYSDLRLKDLNGPIENSLEKVLSLTGYRYTANQTAVDLGYSTEPQVGLVAQEVQAILPEVVTIAPISYEIEEDYLTIKYERLIPLLVEAIKDLKKEIDQLKGK